MSNKKRLVLLAALLLGLWVVRSAAQKSANWDLRWYVISSGGSAYTAANYSAAGTLSQTAIGLVSSTGYKGELGYWYGIGVVPGVTATNVDLTVTAIEVTQAIQCFETNEGLANCQDNSLSLAEGKHTVARVYVDIGSQATGPVPLVSARLQVRRAGTLVGTLAPFNSGGMISAVKNPDRANTHDTLNFILPPNLASGSVSLVAEVNHNQTVEETNYTNNTSAAVNVTFHKQAKFTVAYKPINYQAAHRAAPFLPTSHIHNGWTVLYQLYPIALADLDYRVWPTLTFTRELATGLGTWQLDEDELTKELNRQWKLAVTNGNWVDQLYGWLPANTENCAVSDPNWPADSLTGTARIAFGDDPSACGDSKVDLAHEIAHNLSCFSNHATDPTRQGCGACCGRNWPYANPEIQEFGFDILNLTVVDDNQAFDLMSYCNPRWIAPFTHQNLFTELTSGYTCTNGGGPQAGQPPEGGFEASGGSVATQQRYVLASGTVRTDHTGFLDSCYQITSPYEPSRPQPTGAYALRFLNANRQVIREWFFGVSFRHAETMQPKEAASFVELVPYPDATARILLVETATQRVLDEVALTAHAPVVTLIAPNGGESWEGRQRITWQARDADGDALLYAILYSSDGGETWLPLVTSWTEPSYEVNTDELAGSERAYIRVLATDGLNTTMDDADEPFVVADKPPIVTIAAPSASAHLARGATVLLLGRGYDLEEGTLGDEAYIWSSDRDGRLGRGAALLTTGLSPGRHVITLTAVDSAGHAGAATVEVVVGAAAVYVSPRSATGTISGTTTLELRIADIENLYGAQIEMAFDPALVEVVDADASTSGIQVQQGDFPIAEVTHINQADNAAGRIQYAISLRGVKPGVSGSGALARITFHGLRPGVSRVELTRVVLSDPRSVPIAARVEGGVVSVQGAGAVAGRVILERRSSNAGATVCVGRQCVTTSADGRFTIADAPAGVYTATVSHMSYLRSWRSVTVPAGQTLTLPDVTLLGGDVNQDDHIEVADGLLIARAWNSAPGAGHWDERADLTDDDQVNILDWVAVQYNWDKMAPGPWAVASPLVGAASPVAPPLVGDLATQVVISPSLTTLAGVGETARLDIRVEEVRNLEAARVQVHFDPRVLQVRDADPRPSAPGVQVLPGDFLDLVNQQVLVNQVDNVAGTLDYAVAQTYPAQARSGSGVLAVVEFEAVGRGSSAVHLVRVRLLDNTRPDPLEIAAGTQDGRVVVGVQNTVYLPLILKDMWRP